MYEVGPDAKKYELGPDHQLDLVFRGPSAFYFAAQSTTDVANRKGVCYVNKVLLVKVTMIGREQSLKKLWIDVPVWECRVLAQQSDFHDDDLFFYVFGWDEKQLQVKTFQVSATHLSLVKIHPTCSVLGTLATLD